MWTTSPNALLACVPESTAVGAKMFEIDDGQPNGYLHVQMARLIAAAVGRNALPLSLPAGVLRVAARGDRLLRGKNARLTPDRVGYMVHPDWVSSPALAMPEDLWQPRIGARTGFAETARWYRAQGWL